MDPIGWLLFQGSKSASDHSRPGTPSFTIARFSCGPNLLRQSGISRPLDDSCGSPKLSRRNADDSLEVKTERRHVLRVLTRCSLIQQYRPLESGCRSCLCDLSNKLEIQSIRGVGREMVIRISKICSISDHHPFRPACQYMLWSLRIPS